MKLGKSKYLRGKKIVPSPIPGNARVVELVDSYFQAYNAGRLREACHLFANRMLQSDVTIGMSLTGALTPAGLGGSCVVPLMKAGFVDWIVSTGANLYHDAHFAIGKSLHRGSPFIDDRILRKEGVIRIYDILFDYDVLLSTDKFFRTVIRKEEFQKEMGTAELHYKLGKYIHERERILKIKHPSVLSTAYQCGVPVYTSSPGDSSIGMNIAEIELSGYATRIDVLLDVNETAAIVLDAKRKGGRSGVLIFGGGSPKNFLLQTEPQIQEVLQINEKGHDFFLQITDARPDTGGLSGATPSEAVSWGKVDPNKLPDTVVAYLDSTVAMPILTSYALAQRKPRKLKRLYERRGELVDKLRAEYFKGLKKRSR
ncbi:MAG: deoxyhypusine synthase [Ignavibacteriae bacterium]|nr:deoxyhypusine synthase [Ignavibacteriota bacterium]